jgi:hypothetical protein
MTPDCGHPNHGGWDHACAPFVMTPEPTPTACDNYTKGTCITHGSTTPCDQCKARGGGSAMSSTG